MSPEPGPAFVAWAEERQRRYSANRARWARRIGRPYADDTEAPEPGALDAADPEDG